MEKQPLEDIPQPYISFVRAGHPHTSDVRQYDTSIGATESGETVSQVYKSIVLSHSSKSPQPSKRKRVKSVIVPVESIQVKPSLPSPSSPQPKPNAIFSFCQNGKVKQVERWLAGQPNVDLRDGYGWTLLMVASCAGHLQIVRLLLEANADSSLRCSKGQSAVDLARKSHHTNVIKAIEEHCNRKESADDDNVEQCNKMEPNPQIEPFECVHCGLVSQMDRTAHELSITHQLKSGQFSSEQTRQLGNYAHLNRHFKGYRLLVKEGWNETTGLGAREDGRKYPIVAKKKPDRACIGLNQNAKAVDQLATQPPPRIERIKLKQKLRGEQKHKQRIEKDFRESFRDDHL